MWWIELNTAFYLPFVHTTTLITSIIDAAAELLELGTSLHGAVYGKSFRIDNSLLYVPPDVSEDEVMWTCMATTNKKNTSATDILTIDMGGGKNYDPVQVQRFATLWNFYSLDGVPVNNMPEDIIDTERNWDIKVSSGIPDD